MPNTIWAKMHFPYTPNDLSEKLESVEKDYYYGNKILVKRYTKRDLFVLYNSKNYFLL